MKTLFTFLATAFICASVLSQSPEKMSYQAVVRNSSDVLVTNTQVGMQISILQDSEAGTPVYTETQTPTTNANGLVSIEIGGGAGFGDIDWADGPYFIKTETDPAGGTNYSIAGTSELLSVPYALYSLNGIPGPQGLAGVDGTNGIDGAKGDTGDQGIQGEIGLTGASGADGLTTSVNSIPHVSGNITLTTENIPASTDKNYVTDAQLTVIGNTSGTNTGDNATNTQYSGLVTNATHTGDATGATALTVVGINGTSLAGLATGILKNTASTGVPSIAVAGTDYLTPTGSAALLTNFPLLNQNTTGNAATVTTNANLTGMVTSDGNATTVVTNANLAGDVISSGNVTTIANKVTMSGTSPVSITGSPTVIATGAVAISIAAATTSAAGSMSAADKTKLDGITTTAHTLGESYGGGIVFYVTPEGLHGLIAETQDQSISCNWYDAQDVISNPGNHSTTGINYTDWRLPTKYELILLYQQRSGVGGFAGNYYWSSSEINYLNAYAWDFTTNSQVLSGKTVANYVRAVRAF